MTIRPWSTCLLLWNVFDGLEKRNWVFGRFRTSEVAIQPIFLIANLLLRAKIRGSNPIFLMTFWHRTLFPHWYEARISVGWPLLREGLDRRHWRLQNGRVSLTFIRRETHEHVMGFCFYEWSQYLSINAVIICIEESLFPRWTRWKLYSTNTS